MPVKFAKVSVVLLQSVRPAGEVWTTSIAPSSRSKMAMMVSEMYFGPGGGLSQQLAPTHSALRLTGGGATGNCRPQGS